MKKYDKIKRKPLTGLHITIFYLVLAILLTFASLACSHLNDVEMEMEPVFELSGTWQNAKDDLIGVNYTYLPFLINCSEADKEGKFTADGWFEYSDTKITFSSLVGNYSTTANTVSFKATTETYTIKDIYFVGNIIKTPEGFKINGHFEFNYLNWNQVIGGNYVLHLKPQSVKYLPKRTNKAHDQGGVF